MGNHNLTLPLCLDSLGLEVKTLSEANFLGHLIFGLVDATVDTTVCKGQILMQGKRILSLDEERIAARSRELAPRMWQRLQAL